MLNSLFSLIGKSIAPSGGGVVAAVSVRATEQSFPPAGTFISEETMTAYGDVNGVNTGIGTFYRITYANGTGGTYTEDTAVTYYTYGTLLRQEDGSYTVSICDGNWGVGGYSNYWYADGYGGYYTGGAGGYSSYGTYLTNCNGYNHYSDGSGGYYSESDGSSSSYQSAGTPTGNSGSGDNYIEINGSTYNNGTYSYTEYHDGNGGYYNSYSYNYQYYGYTFTTSSYYDEGMMMEYTTYFNSDGNGGYYTTY